MCNMESIRSVWTHCPWEMWLCINSNWNLRTISQEMFKVSLLHINLKISALRLQLHSPGANELMLLLNIVLWGIITTLKFSQNKHFLDIFKCKNVFWFRFHSLVSLDSRCIMHVHWSRKWLGTKQATGPRLNIKTVLSTYGDFHVKDKTAARTSYL